jgi:hypothetical protein
MEIMDAVQCGEGGRTGVGALALPADAKIVFQILAGEEGPASNRRRFARSPYRSHASMDVVGDPLPIARTIYTRDANQWGVGFVTQEAVPVGRDAMLHLTVGGREMTVRCCILRCREVLPGWFEGGALFFDEEPLLARPSVN